MTTRIRSKPRGADTHQEDMAANVRLSSLLAASNVVQRHRNQYVVKSVVPSVGEIEGKGESLAKAFGTLAEQIVQKVMEAGSMKQWPAEWMQVLDEAPHVHPAAATKAERTKERHLTIGLTISDALHRALEERASVLESSVSQVARELYVNGLAALERSVDEHNLDKALSGFRDSFNELNAGENVRWMLRVERRKYLEGQLLARELRCSLAQLAGWCVQFALRNAPALS